LRRGARSFPVEQPVKFELIVNLKAANAIDLHLGPVHKERIRTSGDRLGRGRGLRALAHERRRFGYRRLHVLLRREGFIVNHKRLFRIYREERLMVRRRGGRKRALGTRAPLAVPQWPNERWSLDFVADPSWCPAPASLGR
jgi:transposase InsO family protein